LPAIIIFNGDQCLYNQPLIRDNFISDITIVGGMRL